MGGIFLAVLVAIIGIFFSIITRVKIGGEIGDIASAIMVFATILGVFLCCGAQIGGDIGKYHGWRDAQRKKCRCE